MAQEEAEETQYWLELLSDLKILFSDILGPLHKEAGELTAILTASTKTAKANRQLLVHPCGFSSNRQSMIVNHQCFAPIV